ncbi:MAG: DUF4258 domain-containing protein [Anaerolineae bacterium]|nr:DUF4258 domain-containing protein [Anaerolineae bacterium]
MYIVDIEDLLSLRSDMRVSDHALREAHKEGLRAKDILYAVFNGQIIEQYTYRDRVLILGPIRGFNTLPLHVVCDYSSPDEIVIITVYIPNRIQWTEKPVRRRKTKRDGSYIPSQCPQVS